MASGSQRTWCAHRSAPPEDPRCLDLWPEPDLERAKQLVQEYLDDGNSLDEPLDLVGGTANAPIFELVQLTLARIGIDAEIRTLPTPEYVGERRSGNFDLIHFSATPSPGTHQSWLRRIDIDRDYIHRGPEDPELQAAIDSGDD